MFSRISARPPLLTPSVLPSLSLRTLFPRASLLSIPSRSFIHRPLLPPTFTLRPLTQRLPFSTSPPVRSLDTPPKVEPAGTDGHKYPVASEDPPPPKTWADALLLRSVPLAPKTLGILGLIPYAANTGLIAYMPEACGLLSEVQLIYSACILSFMGAVQWGLAMANYGNSHPNISRYIFSVIPPIVSFMSALFTPTTVSLLIHAAGFIMLLAYDVHTTKLGMSPAWYPGLRVVLTTVVVTCIGITVGVCWAREKRLKEDSARDV